MMFSWPKLVKMADEAIARYDALVVVPKVEARPVGKNGLDK